MAEVGAVVVAGVAVPVVEVIAGVAVPLLAVF